MKYIKTYKKLFESTELWNDFFNKINNKIIPKDPYDNNIDQLMKYNPIGKVLDISTGDGSNSEYFMKNGYDVYGTDISDVAINTLKDKYPNHNWLIHDTEKKFPFNDNMFDIVFAKLSLHYFSKESISKIIQDIYRIMKTGGSLFIMVKISNTDNLDTGKKQYTSIEWEELVQLNKLTIIDKKSENKKAYSFEKSPSDLFYIIAKKL